MTLLHDLKAHRTKFKALTVHEWFRDNDLSQAAPDSDNSACMWTVLDMPWDRRVRLGTTLASVIRDLYPQRVSPSALFPLHTVVAFNDHPDTTKAEADAVWDEAVRRTEAENGA